MEKCASEEAGLDEVVNAQGPVSALIPVCLVLSCGELGKLGCFSILTYFKKDVARTSS